MDTPDRAAAFVDEELADAVHKDWLLLSTRSSQISQAWDRFETRETWQTNSWSVNDTTTFISPHSGNIYGKKKENESTANEFSWLLSSDTKKRPSMRSAHLLPRHLHKPASSINTCIIYDNISFVDSFISQPPSEHGNEIINQNYGSLEKDYAQSKEEECDRSANFIPKFRLFIAFYLVTGITLSIYSRNALSLAAVGMLASNAINTELDAYLTQNPINLHMTTSREGFEKPADGSCPIFRNKQILSNITSYATSEEYLSTRKRLEDTFRASVRQKVETGELINWTPSEQGLVFASGSLGNLLIAIPLTRLGEIYGPKWIIFIALSGATLQAALMPIVASCRLGFVILFQIIFNGLTYGADCVAYTLFAHWLPPTEMAFFVSSLLICYQLGTITSSFVTARLLTQGYAWSWCFYTPAILCGAWTFLWAVLGASEPNQSLFISKRELDYLNRYSKISQVAAQANEMSTLTNDKSVSWLKLFSDKNIWAIISVKFSIRWYFSVYASLMPTFLSSVAHMSVKTIGQVSVFQSIVCLISGVLMSFFTRSVVHKRPFNLSLAAFRKIFQSIVNFGLAINLLIFISFDCNSFVTVTALTLSGICINFYVAAGLQLPLDLSSEHCGLITSISNTLALGQVLGAPISGLILNRGPRDRSLWRIVWLLAIMLNTVSGLLFICLVDSKPNNYNKSLREKDDLNDNQIQDEPTSRQRKKRQEY